MKWTNLFAVPLMAVLLLGNAPVVRAAVFQQGYSQGNGDKYKKRKQVPEGSATAILVVAAAAVGGGLLVWRRKRRVPVA